MIQAMYFYDKTIKCGVVRTQCLIVELDDDGAYSFHAPHFRSIASRWSGKVVPTRVQSRDWVKDKPQ
jgi:hypothetical protein